MNPETYPIDPNNPFALCHITKMKVSDPLVPIEKGMVLVKGTNNTVVPWPAMSSNVTLFLATEDYIPGQSNEEINVVYSGLVPKSEIKFVSGDWNSVSSGRTPLDNFLVFSQITPTNYEGVI